MNQAADYAENAEQLPSRGLGYATGVLIFMWAEISIYAGVRPSQMTDSHRLAIAAMVAIAFVQMLGMWLTSRGRHRLGGNLQIFASALHIVDVIGVIGIIGGVLSKRYPDKRAALSGA